MVTFTQTAAFPIGFDGGFPHPAATADFDGDGQDEVVVSSLQDTRLVILKEQFQPDGRSDLVVLQEKLFNEQVLNVEAHDLDDDGAVDLIVSTASGVRVLQNNGFANGVVTLDQVGQVIPAGNGFYGMEVDDVDRDGQLDLILGNFNQDEITVLRDRLEPDIIA